LRWGPFLDPLHMYNTKSFLAVVYDDQDPLGIPFLYHLNISYLFYHNQYNTDISFNVQAYALHSGSSTSDSKLKKEKSVQNWTFFSDCELAIHEFHHQFN
jgi:hypothetical protein